MNNNDSEWQSSSRGRGTTGDSNYRQNSDSRSDNRSDYRQGYNRNRTNSYSHSSDERYQGGERRRFHSSDEQEHRSYNRYNGEGNRSEEGYRPRYNSDSRDGEVRRPRFNAEGENSRPRFNPNGESRPRRARIQSAPADGERSTRYARVGYSNQSEGNSRPRFNADGEGHRPRFNAPRRDGSVYSKRKQMAYHQKEVDMTKPVRLNKFLANAGICSRREADDFIQAGIITVNGEIVTQLGAKVLPTDKVMFHDQPVHSEHKVYILLNKPKDCVTTTDDPQERKTVLDIVKNACAERIYPVGRLDRNTTGVLLLTNDGDLAAKLTHPKYGKKKIYAATLDRDLEQESFDAIMAGVQLDNEVIVPDALEFTREDDHRHIGLEIHSGQNRVVRRLFEKVGYKVLQLDRVSFAGLTKKNVPRGKYRFLTPKEVAMLQMGAFE